MLVFAIMTCASVKIFVWSSFTPFNVNDTPFIMADTKIGLDKLNFADKALRVDVVFCLFVLSNKSYLLPTIIIEHFSKSILDFKKLIQYESCNSRSLVKETTIT